MEQIRAFVGHSFAEKDEQVVRKVLDFLTTVSHTHPGGFTWAHAQGPQPRGIDEKVLDRFADKNLFIGVCTRSERVVSGVQTCWWAPKRKVLANIQDLEWKTSDWIIQEIGLAYGRGMHVILLVENGVRKPGGIQGSLEHVPFSREAPEACFTALLDMIAALAPRPTPAGEAGAVVAAAPSVVDHEASPSNKADWTVPKPDWTRSDYELAMLFAIHIKDLQKQADLNDKFLASSAGGTEEARLRWQASCQRVKVFFGDASAFALLKEIATKAPRDAEVVEALARGYKGLGEFAAAATGFENAASLRFDEPVHQARLLGQAALMNQRAGGDDQKYLDRMREVVSREPEAEQEALKVERDMATETGEEDVVVGALEKLLALDPADLDVRFAVALKHSNAGRDDLAAYHYLKIPDRSRSAGAWNNLGVSFDKLGLPAQSVRAYREAEAAGETLAVSNLAIRLLDAGFVPEAIEMLERAQSIADHHKNVDSTMSRAKSVEENEVAKKTTALSRAPAVSAFYRDFGSATTKMMPKLTGIWNGPQGPLEVLQEGNLFIARGRFPEPRNALARAVMGQFGVPDEASPSLQEVEYKGQIHGRAIKTTKRVRRLGEPTASSTSTLLGGRESPEVLIWLSDDGVTLACMERDGAAAPTYYSIARQS